MEKFPDELLRGISSDTAAFITPEGYPTQAAFRFDDFNPALRKDEYCELSINWFDNEDAIKVLLNQMNQRKGGFQFQGGYCKLSRLVLETSMRAYINNMHLKYERSPIYDDSGIVNPYHGNILMNNNLSKQAKTNIQVTLAGIAGIVIKRNND